MELKNRVKAQTPKWFKKIIRLGIILAAAGTAILTANGTVPGFELPETLKHVSQWMVVGGLVAAATGKTAKEDCYDEL